MSESDDGFFSDSHGSSSLFLDDEDLDPEEETVVLDGSSAELLNRSMPVIFFDNRFVLVFSRDCRDQIQLRFWLVLCLGQRTQNSVSKVQPKPQKVPATSTVSTPPDDDDCVKVVSIEPLPKSMQDDVSVIAKPGICQYMKVSGCEGMCQVLQTLDEKVAERKLKKVWLSLKYHRTKSN